VKGGRRETRAPGYYNESYSAALGIVEALQEGQQRRFPRAGFADQSHARSRTHLQAEILEDLAAIGITEGDGVDVVRPRAIDVERVQRLVDQIGSVPAGARVEVGLADDSLEVRSREQDAAQYRDLLACVRSHRHAGHQWLEQRLRVHVDTRRRFVLVRQPKYDDGADDRHQPGNAKPDPAALPHSSRKGE